MSITYEPNTAALDDPSVSEAERIRRLCPYCQHGDAVMFKVGSRDEDMRYYERLHLYEYR